MAKLSLIRHRSVVIILEMHSSWVGCDDLNGAIVGSCSSVVSYTDGERLDASLIISDRHAGSLL